MQIEALKAKVYEKTREANSAHEDKAALEEQLRNSQASNKVSMCTVL